jgi:hypothetical protein
LKDVRIDLASDISIFVGANNSGKTSASHALQLFTTASRDRFSIHDFSVDCWDAINAFGEGVERNALPSISLDILFNVGVGDLHRVVDLLPSLAWQGNLVGVRVEFAASDPEVLLANFRQTRERARQNIRPGADGGPDYDPSPRTLCDYLGGNSGDRLRREFELRFYVLDRGARVYYALSPIDAERDPPTLPDRYNGLGFKNLIYMVVELLDLHSQWLDVEENRAPLHLIFIEEPEAHHRCVRTKAARVVVRLRSGAGGRPWRRKTLATV